VPAGGIFERRAEHDLRGIDRPAVATLAERGLKGVGGALGARGFERDDPGRLQSEAQLAVPHGDGVEKGVGPPVAARVFQPSEPSIGKRRRPECVVSRWRSTRRLSLSTVPLSSCSAGTLPPGLYGRSAEFGSRK